LVLLPSRDDRARARDAGGGAARPGPGPLHQPCVLDPVVEGGAAHSRPDGRRAMKHPHRSGASRWRALRTILALTAACLGAVELMAAPVASAHPLGNFTINRYSDLVLSPGAVRVGYIVD